MTTPSPLESRLERVEKLLAGLSMEVAAIRAELEAREPTPKTAQTARRLPPPRASLSAKELERLVGSYGMLAIAVLAAVAAVGTFLSWAISHGYLALGPAARVAIGLGFAVAIGVWGSRLRRRERSFGSSLLGLALVVVHVCAYAVGPSFGLVPTWVAFVGAAMASSGLAVFAHGENDEALWCVGFGGAAVAPFVTSNGHGSLYALLAYGTLVLFSACYALGRRAAWPIAWRVFYLAAALFVTAAAWQARSQGTTPFIATLAFPFTVAAVGVIPFAALARRRGALRWLEVLASIVAIAGPRGLHHDAWTIATALFAASCLGLLFADRETEIEQSSILAPGRSSPTLLDWIDVAAIPMLFALLAADAVAPVASSATLDLAGAALFVAFAWRRGVGSQRDAAAFAAVAMTLVAHSALSLEAPTGEVTTFLAIGLSALVIHRLRPSRSWLWMGALSFLAGASTSIEALLNRRPYLAQPFVTEPSIAAVVVLAALIVVSRSWRSLRTATRAALGMRSEWTYVATLRLVISGATLSPWVWTFLWILIELAMAFSPSASTLFLVTYFAATGVGCVAVGRARHSSRLRQVGLALALVSAATAVYGAHAYFDFGARIVAYLVTSAFLLGIAYWYRRPGAAPSPV